MLQVNALSAERCVRQQHRIFELSSPNLDFLQARQRHRNSLPPTVSASPVSRINRADSIASSPPQASDEVWRAPAEESPMPYSSRRSSVADDHSPAPTRPSMDRNATIIRQNSVGHSRSFSVIEPARRTDTSMSGLRPRTLHASPLLDSEGRGGRTPTAAALEMVNRSFPGPDGRIETDRESVSSTSTTAQSSVWSELDDLKSRIRRLEKTGRMPPSHLSNSSSERPRTATTAATTISSSPNRGADKPGMPNGPSPVGSTFSTTGGGGVPHPLLHAAIEKSRTALPSTVFQNLESVANEALSLVSLVGNSGAGANLAATSSSLASDRIVRRKVDSVCRGLTELAISLNENQTEMTSNARPASLLPPSYITSPSPRAPSIAGRESVLDRTRAVSRFAERQHSISSLSAAAGAASVYSSPRRETLFTQNDNMISPRQSVRDVRQRSLADRDDTTSTISSRFRTPSRAITDVAGRHERLSSLTASRAYERPSPISTEMRSRYSTATNNTLSSPTLPGRRFFSSEEREQREQRLAEPKTPRTYELRTSTGERLLSDDEENRYERTGSLSRASTTGGRRERTSLGLGLSRRESVEYERRPSDATERLLRR